MTDARKPTAPTPGEPQPVDASRPCAACDSGEKTITPPYTEILGPGMPVHHPSGSVCAKYMPTKLYEALASRATQPVVPPIDGEPLWDHVEKTAVEVDKWPLELLKAAEASTGFKTAPPVAPIEATPSDDYTEGWNQAIAAAAEVAGLANSQKLAVRAIKGMAKESKRG